ncbi:hypothetical protein XENOCAPTIV_013736, partial [Xenoophorus captivus]
CEWDGLDCANNMPEKLADGHLVLLVHIPPEQLKNRSSSFLRELSSVLHTNVVFRRDAKGEPMVFPYYGNEQDLVKHNVLKRSADGWPEWASMPANVLDQMKESLSSIGSQRKRRELDPVQVKGGVESMASFGFRRDLDGGGLDTGNSEEEEDPSTEIISDFIYHGANLHNQTDRTGETALHLAARYARSDAAKRLLESSADANVQDNMGRTPLHAAVAADAQGVFQVARSFIKSPTWLWVFIYLAA